MRTSDKPRMKTLTVLLSLLAFLAVSVHAADSAFGGKAKYPGLPCAEKYREFTVELTDRLIEQIEEKPDKQKIYEFIFARMSVPEFEDAMLEQSPLLKQAQSDPTLKDSAKYKEELDALKAVLSPMCAMVISQSHDVYLRKILRPDSVTKPLFEASKDKETEMFISWIRNKAKPGDYTGKATLQEGDQIFHYRSPEFSWKMMFGREGFLVFRDNKLVDNQITEMN
jgi:hypothetical protein